MKQSKIVDLLPDEVVMNKIYLIGAKKIMLDFDLGILYDVETKRLKEAVRRNIERFPDDFMFELTQNEYEALRTQFAASNYGRGGRRYLPMAFTEQGVTMLSCILNSERAIGVNIQIIRIFTKLRESLINQKDILLQLEKMETKLAGHDAEILLIFKYLKQMLSPQQPPRRRIGFRRKDEE